MSEFGVSKLDLLKQRLQSCSLHPEESEIISNVDLSNSDLNVFPLQELLPLRDSLEVLNLGGNQLSSLPPELALFRKLRILFFAGNNFTEVPTVLGSLPDLYMLSFKSNRVSSVPAESLSPSLGWLILTDNQIRSLPGNIGRLAGLRKCMLAANELTALPPEMAHCRSLELLRIAANRLEVLPDWLLRLPRLRWLAFAGNPLCAEGSRAGAAALAGLRVIDHSELMMGDKLGEGASGVVYQALWLPPAPAASISDEAPAPPPPQQQQLAVKIFKSGATSDGLPEDEMQAMLAAGSHANCVQVLGRVANAPDGALGLVLPLIPPSHTILGNPPSFQTVTRDTYPSTAKFNISTILHVAKGILSVCAHLHSRGISHGDLYAHNILVDPSGSPMLSDFGAASFYSGLPNATRGALQGLEVGAFGCLLEDLLERVDGVGSGAEGDRKGGGEAGEAGGETLRAVSSIQRLCMGPEPIQRPSFADLEAMFRDLDF